MKLLFDKIASVTKNIDLSSDISMTEKFAPEEGTLLVVKVLEDKKIYNQLELVSGRLSTLKKGDIVVVALGNRRALKGFVGEVPKTLHVGDIINILNLGGVAGICTSENIKEVGHALKVKVLGALIKKGKVPGGGKESSPLNIKQFTLFSPENTLKSTVPLIVVSGTCMNVGKTSVACEIIKQANQKKMKIFSAKLAGIAALRDTENMKDFGAKKAVSFVDAGYTSTINNGDASVSVTKGAIEYLSAENPDYIVIEFGDGLYGEYGVMKILQDKQIQKNIIAHIGCAHDPMGASKLVEVCQKIGAPIDVLSGPVTDNSVGAKFIANSLNLPAFNALFHGEQLFHYIYKTCLKK